MTVIPLLTVGYTGSSQIVCNGTVPAQLTGTPPLNGVSSTYQWQSSIDNNLFTNVEGATNLNYQPGITTITTYFRQMQNALETCNGPLPTNTVTITVYDLLPVSISIGVSSNPACHGSPVTYSATPVNGGTAPAYQWQVNSINISGATNANYIVPPENNDTVTCVLTSNAPCTIGNPATSNKIAMTVNQPVNVSVSINASANPVFAGTLVTFTATPVNGGTAPVYSWKVNGTIVIGANSSTYSFIPEDGDFINCLLVSNAFCAMNNPATSNFVMMKVSSVPSTLVLQNFNITDAKCFDANETITVAGSGSEFTIQSGGSATMIAGNKINFLPGTKVFPGGYLHGYITTTGQYCDSKSPSAGTAVEEIKTNTIHVTEPFFKIYPNPTDGILELELNGLDATEIIRIEIYNMTGEKVISTAYAGGRKHQLSLSGKPGGIYLLQVVSAKFSGTARIIKQ